MSEYVYVRVVSDSKTWHLTLNGWMTLCGYEERGWKYWGRFQRSEKPQEPLCKRCIKCREARER